MLADRRQPTRGYLGKRRDHRNLDGRAAEIQPQAERTGARAGMGAGAVSDATGLRQTSRSNCPMRGCVFGAAVPLRPAPRRLAATVLFFGAPGGLSLRRSPVGRMDLLRKSGEFPNERLC
jgi:hypothetical protein